MVTRWLTPLVCVLLLAVATPAQDVTQGKSIFQNKGNCAACHGNDATGTPMAPDLTDAEWLNVDGSLEQIRQLIRSGVPRPKKHPAMMPPMGGAKLKDAEIEAVANYVLSLQRPSSKAPVPASDR